MIDREGHVRLTDFGVARLCDPGDPTTSHGTIVGTPKYMSPEQIRGERVDGRSDLFSAGVLLYQMLTGLRPFDAPGDFGVWQQICSEKQQPASSINPDLPPDIDDVLDKALAKRREDRYRSAREFALALRLVARAGRIASSASSQPISAPLLLPAPAAIGASGPPSLPPKPAGSNSLTMELELLYWKEIRDSDDPADFHTFLRKFEDGIYAHLARRRLRWLTHVGGDDSKGDASDRSSLPPLSDQGLRGATGALDWWPDETSTDDGLPP
jgi:serine/threonine-protein kinase